MSLDVAAKVRAFIDDNFMFRARAGAIDDTTDLVKEAIVDSAGVLVLIAFLEETFSITVADDDVEPDNLGSIAAIVAYVGRKTEGNG